jgi:hypothetical protein
MQEFSFFLAISVWHPRVYGIRADNGYDKLAELIGLKLRPTDCGDPDCEDGDTTHNRQKTADEPHLRLEDSMDAEISPF